jgi:hypothetical protein
MHNRFSVTKSEIKRISGLKWIIGQNGQTGQKNFNVEI